ncbi:MAG: ion transporter [Gammaproteobacteria bacterium]|nr:ion transporter [Gammaproteobacteria bacterium]
MTNSTIQQNFERIRSNKAFELFVVTVIITSALLVGAKTYELAPGSRSIIVWLDMLITVVFVAEITIRFIAEPDKKAFFRNGWNLFDTLVVTISLVPIDNSDLVLVARLVRVFRVLRMISIIPELRMLLASLLKALPQLGYVILLMFIIFYIYAAIGATLFESINPTLWGDIAISMLTLFRVMTFEDWTDVMYETMAVYPLSWVFYLSFIFFTAFAFLNMVIGIVVNVMHTEAEKMQQDKDPEAPEISLQEVQQQLLRLQHLLEAQGGSGSYDQASTRSGQ